MEAALHSDSQNSCPLPPPPPITPKQNRAVEGYCLLTKRERDGWGRGGGKKKELTTLSFRAPLSGT